MFRCSRHSRNLLSRVKQIYRTTEDFTEYCFGKMMSYNAEKSFMSMDDYFFLKHIHKREMSFHNTKHQSENILNNILCILVSLLCVYINLIKPQ